MRLTLALGWPHANEPRREEKNKALRDLGLKSSPAHCQEAESSEVALQLELDLKDLGGSQAAAELVVDAMQILVMTDLELCFWPPVLSSQTQAWKLLSKLRQCARRRALLTTRRVLGSEKSADSRVSTALRTIHEGVQKLLDAFCVAPHAPLGRKEPISSLAGSCHIWAHRSVVACDLPGRGWGLVMEEDTEGGQELLRVPEDALLNIFSAVKSEHFGTTAHQLLRGGLHVEAVTMLFALAERRRCETATSPWSALFARAPKLSDAPTLLAWPEKAIAALGSEQIRSHVHDALLSVEALSQEVALALKELPEALRESLQGPVTFHDLLWTRCLFDSRAVSVEIQAIDFPDTGQSLPTKIVCLAPEVDHLNHSFFGVCAPPFFDAGRRELVVRLAAKASAGCEVCLCYGALQNWEMLMYYGFCPDVNPHDRVTIDLDLPTGDNTAAVELLLQLHGVPTEHALRPPGPHDVKEKEAEFITWADLGLLPPQLFRCLRVFLVDDIQSLDLDAAPGEGHVELDLLCLATLKDLLQGLLAPLLQPIECQDSVCQKLIKAFRSSQCTLLQANLNDVVSLETRLQLVAASLEPEMKRSRQT